MIRDPLQQPIKLVIDTSLLVLILGYKCMLLDKAEPLERVRVLNQIRGRDGGILTQRFDDLWSLFWSAASRTVTQHVIADGLSTLGCGDP